MPISFSSDWLTLFRRSTGSSSSSSPWASGSFRVRFAGDQVGRATRPPPRSAAPSPARAAAIAPAPPPARRSGGRERASASTCGRAGGRHLLVDVQPHLVAGVLGDVALDARPAQPLDQDLQATVGQLAHAHDDADGADLVQRPRLGILLARLTLRDDEAEAILGLQRLLDRLQRDRPGHAQRRDHVREDHQVANRQQRQDLGNLLREASSSSRARGPCPFI